MKKITNIFNGLCRWVSYCSMTACVIIMTLMTVDVFLRLVFNKPILGAYEFVTMIMTILIFSSWSYTQTEHGHIHVTMFLNIMPAKVKFFLFFITSLLSTVIMGMVTYATLIQTIKLMGNNTATTVLLIPHWPFVGLECLSIALFALVLLVDTIKAFLAMFNNEYAKEVTQYWV